MYTQAKDGITNTDSKSLNLKTKLFVILFLLCGVIRLSMPAPVRAADRTSFGVDPLEIKLDLIAGENKTQDIKIYNLNNEEQEYIVYYERFEVIGERGRLRFHQGKDKELTLVFNESKLTIPANSSKTFTVTFESEKPLPQKEYYYVIFVEPIPTTLSAEGSSSKVTGKIGVLTYINLVHSGEILGEDVKSGQVVEFSAQKKWSLKSPVQFTAKINNTGNTHFKSYGTINFRQLTQSVLA